MVINKLQSKSITNPKNNIIIDTYKDLFVRQM